MPLIKVSILFAFAIIRFVSLTVSAYVTGINWRTGKQGEYKSRD